MNRQCQALHRGFRSFYRNYLDEMAMSVCASIPTDGPGYIYAVRRKCGESYNCQTICDGSRFRNTGNNFQLTFHRKILHNSLAHKFLLKVIFFISNIPIKGSINTIYLEYT